MKETSTKSRVARPKRKSVGVRDRLQIINKDPSKEYRLVNADPARIFELEQLGYEVVNIANHLPKGQRLDSTKQPDNSIPVGGGQTQILMAIDKDLYEEGQRDKEEQAAELEASLRPNLSDGQYGKISISSGKE